MNSITGLEEATEASIAVIDRSPPAIDTIVTPILTTASTSLGGVLKNLDGFMKLADLVAEVFAYQLFGRVEYLEDIATYHLRNRFTRGSDWHGELFPWRIKYVAINAILR